MHPSCGDLVRLRPCAESIVGVDRKLHACPYVGDLPLLTVNSQGEFVKITLHNVRFAPTMRDTLLSVEQLWRDNQIAAKIQDECVLELKSGDAIPMSRKRGLFLSLDGAHRVQPPRHLHPLAVASAAISRAHSLRHPLF